MLDLENRTALVTGGASGIGLGIAKSMARAGARVAIADISADQLGAAVAAAEAEGLALKPFVLDVRDEADVARVADEVDAALGPVTVAALNAGVGILGRMQDAGYSEWDWIMGVNLGGVMNGVRVLAPRLKARGLGGHVVATASLGGLAFGSFGGIYAASKAGIIAAMQQLRGEMAPHGVGVSVLCPGVVSTNIHKPFDTRRPDDRAPQYVLTADQERSTEAMLRGGMSPEEVGDQVVEGVRHNQLYIVTHDDSRWIMTQRRDALLASLG